MTNWSISTFKGKLKFFPYKIVKYLFTVVLGNSKTQKNCLQNLKKNCYINILFLHKCKKMLEYQNFKKFYSIVLMGLVGSHYRFVWGSCGFPGNSHDAVIFVQQTSGTP